MAYTKWTTTENEIRLADAVASSKSILEVCRRLGLQPAGGNIRNIKYHIARLELDTSHHLGKAWNRENYSKPSSSSKNETWRKYLVRQHGHACMECNLGSWQNKPIPLELEHIDGNSSNYDESNLKLLCPNCHALTPTWRRRKSAGSPMAEAADLSPAQ